jgi:cell division protein FtsI (penicillin-binding protein 3)
MKSRIILLFLFLLGFWVLLLLRSIQIQVFPHDRLAALQKRQYNSTIELFPKRGLIRDRNGVELAVSIPAYGVFADPKIIENKKAFAIAVSKVLRISPANVLRKIKDSNKRFVWLGRKIGREKIDRLGKLKLTGLGTIEEPERVYPNGGVLSQVLGFVGQDGQGLEGLELQFDQSLRGKIKKVRVERDARGRPLVMDGRLFLDRPQGADLDLTIDHEIQYHLERELYRGLVENEADSAYGVVLDAKTSGIVAMASVPNFDLNRPDEVLPEFRRNRPVTDAFEPGSVVKSFIVAGALQSGLVKANTRFNCENGKFKIGKRVIREADRHHIYQDLSVTEILAKSSNIGVAKIALQMGPEKVQKVLTDFGLGAKTNIDLPGESRGVMQKLPWAEHLTANISFGHGVMATPLQIAAAYAAIANEGVLRRPSILKSQQGQVVRQVISPEVASMLRLMLMTAASPSGTGAAAMVAGFPVAGKTATAQKADGKNGYSKNEYISSFAGFVPANDPKYVVYVVVDNPRKKYYGSEVAAPIFSRVGSLAVRNAGLVPTVLSKRDLIPKTDKAQVAHHKSIKNIQAMASVLLAEDANLMPDFRGLTVREVMDRIRGTRLDVRIDGQGVVTNTSPAPGETLPANGIAKISLGELQK